jgi:Bacteriophage HK97-gp10, putative tail-component
MSMHVEFEQAGRMPPFAFAPAALRWAAAIDPLVAGEMRRRAPVGKGPGAGNLRRSISSRRRMVEGSVRAEFGATAPYAGFVVDGTSPHTIQARNGRVLRFATSGGQTLYRRSVNHPGTKPNPFADRALQAALPAVRDTFDTIMREAMGGIT